MNIGTKVKYIEASKDEYIANVGVFLTPIETLIGLVGIITNIDNTKEKYTLYSVDFGNPHHVQDCYECELEPTITGSHFHPTWL